MTCNINAKYTCLFLLTEFTILSIYLYWSSAIPFSSWKKDTVPNSRLDSARVVWKAGAGHRNTQVINCRFEGSSHILFSSQLTLPLIHQINQRSVNVRPFHLSGFHTKASKWVCRKRLWSSSRELNYSNKIYLSHAFIWKDPATLFVTALPHGMISIYDSEKGHKISLYPTYSMLHLLHHPLK